jgi:hypothetical protein
VEGQFSKSEYKRHVNKLADALEISVKAARRIVDGYLAGGDYDELVAHEVDKSSGSR